MIILPTHGSSLGIYITKTIYIEAPFPIIALLPIINLCLMVQFSLHQEPLTTFVLPPIMVPSASTQFLPISTLCATCTSASIFVSSPLIVSYKEPLAMEYLEIDKKEMLLGASTFSIFPLRNII